MTNVKHILIVLSMLVAVSLRAELTQKFTGWLTTKDQLIWEGVQLELLSDFHGTMGGAASLNDSPDGPAYFTKNSGSVATLQFHRQDNGNIKGVIVQFTQVGGDVYGKALSARYKAGTAGETDISDGKEYSVATSSGAYYYGVHDLYATINTLTTYTADTAAASWSRIANWSPSAFVSGPWSSAVLNLGGANFDFDVEGLTARSVAITSADAVTLTASKVPFGVPLYDLSGATGKTVLDFDPGASTVLAGSATCAGVASTEATYVIASGKRLYVSDPTAAGTMKITQEGVLGYTGTFDIGANPNPQNGEGLEYAGTHTLNSGIEACPKPVYFSGTTTVPHDKHFVRSTTSDLRIVGGETLIAGKALLSHGSGGYAGANIKVSGGVLKGDPNAADPYIYWGGWSGTINLAVNGTGLWTAAIKPHSSTIGNYDVTIDVSGHGVFAPKALAFNEGSSTAMSGSKLRLSEGGTFVLPTEVPYWLPVSVTTGEATLHISADTAMAAPLTVAAGATLVIRAGTEGAKLALTSISGTGDVIVEGAVLDLTKADYSTFGGTIVTTEGGELLPEGIGEGMATVNVDGTASADKWADLSWKGFFGAPVDPSAWGTGETQAGFAGSGRVEIGEMGDGVLAKSVTVPSAVTVSVGGSKVIPGAIENSGMIEYSGTQSFTEARAGLVGAVTLAGDHSFVLGKGNGDFKPVLNGVVFAGETVFTNTVATGFVPCYTDSGSPLTVTDGIVDLGNLMVCIAHEDLSRLWTADVSGDAVVRGGFLRWGYWHWAKCDIALDGRSRLETPMGPLCGGKTRDESAFMRVSVGGSAVFAPAWLKTAKGESEIGDYESDNRANDLEVVLGRGQAADVEPTFELPETVPSWVGVRAVAEGARLAVPAGRSAVFNGTAVTVGDAKLALAGLGKLDARSAGSFADAAVRLDGATVEIDENPLVCASFEHASGGFELIGRRRGPRTLVRTTAPMTSGILSSLPPIKDRKYALSEDGRELSSYKCTGLVILLK